jgi:hypothetical protein
MASLEETRPGPEDDEVEEEEGEEEDDDVMAGEEGKRRGEAQTAQRGMDDSDQPIDSIRLISVPLIEEEEQALDDGERLKETGVR